MLRIKPWLNHTQLSMERFITSYLEYELVLKIKLNPVELLLCFHKTELLFDNSLI